MSGVSNDGSVMILRGTPGTLGVLDGGRTMRYEVGGNAQFTRLSANGVFAVAFSRVLATGGTPDDLTLFLWDRERGPRPVVVRKGRQLSVRELRDDGSFVAAFSPDGVVKRTIRFRLPDVMEESDGPPPDPPIPIVAPPGYSDPKAVRYSDNGRFAAGHVSNGDEGRRACLWDVAGTPALLPSPILADVAAEAAFFVSDDGERALYAGTLSDGGGGYEMLWIEGRAPFHLNDLLRRSRIGEPDDPLWRFGVYSANGRFITVHRGTGDQYLVRAP
ncbi:MAG: hypothetical protein KIS66_06680 [Fimbriimonadaceae bacterium]|nr:hypothetical protein [Fimbriimonadaceae bacterium]